MTFSRSRTNGNYCSNGYSIHSWKIVEKTNDIHPDEKKKYRVCKICDESRPMWINPTINNKCLTTPDTWTGGPYQPLDDLDELIIQRRNPMYLWKKLLFRVRCKLNPIVIDPTKTVSCVPGVDVCSCHGRYNHMCPNYGRTEKEKEPGVMSWEKTKHIKPLEEPWCDIPLPIGPNKQLMSSKDFYKRWNTVHGKALDYLKYYNAYKCFPSEIIHGKTPKFLMEDPNYVLEGQFIQLSLG